MEVHDMKFVRFESQEVISYGLVEDSIVFRIDGDIFGEYIVTKEKFGLSDVKLLAHANLQK
jgi:hypothetical protein